MHLFKEPGAQRHWSNLYGVLKRAELDARKSNGDLAEAANPLDCLAEMYNDYINFSPQNEVLMYISINGQAVKKQPYQASTSEWVFLVNYTRDLDPCNLSRKHIIRGPDWIKTTWLDCQKYLHTMFQQYNRSRQNDPKKDEWGSQTEYKRWVLAAHWKTAGSNSVIGYTQAMIYSVVVFEHDFEGIGRKMPKGQGVDATLNNHAKAPKHKARKRKKSNNNKRDVMKTQKCIVSAIEKADARERKLRHLRF